MLSKKNPSSKKSCRMDSCNKKRIWINIGLILKCGKLVSVTLVWSRAGRDNDVKMKNRKFPATGWSRERKIKRTRAVESVWKAFVPQRTNIADDYDDLRRLLFMQRDSGFRYIGIQEDISFWRYQIITLLIGSKTPGHSWESRKWIQESSTTSQTPVSSECCNFSHCCLFVL